MAKMGTVYDEVFAVAIWDLLGGFEFGRLYNVVSR